METAVLRSVATALPNLNEGTSAQIEKIWDAAQLFFDWEHQAMILRSPSDEQKEEHYSTLKFLTLMVGFIRKLERNNHSLEMLQTRLDDSWGMFYNPMTDDEAEAVLEKVFPG
jgi:hypothetical protein